MPVSNTFTRVGPSLAAGGRTFRPRDWLTRYAGSTWMRWLNSALRVKGPPLSSVASTAVQGHLNELHRNHLEVVWQLLELRRDRS